MLKRFLEFIERMELRILWLICKMRGKHMVINRQCEICKCSFELRLIKTEEDSERIEGVN